MCRQNNYSIPKNLTIPLSVPLSYCIHKFLNASVHSQANPIYAIYILHALLEPINAAKLQTNA